MIYGKIFNYIFVELAIKVAISVRTIPRFLAILRTSQTRLIILKLSVYGLMYFEWLDRFFLRLKYRYILTCNNCKHNPILNVLRFGIHTFCYLELEQYGWIREAPLSSKHLARHKIFPKIQLTKPSVTTFTTIGTRFSKSRACALI